MAQLRRFPIVFAPPRPRAAYQQSRHRGRFGRSAVAARGSGALVEAGVAPSSTSSALSHHLLLSSPQIAVDSHHRR
jgi:hypothetical protein